MKKIVIAFVAGVLFATAGTAAATAVIERVTASVRTDYSVELDGQKVALKNAPLAYNGSSYLPVKEISELLGKEVGFDNGVIKINTPAVPTDDISVNEMSLGRVSVEIKSIQGAISLTEWAIRSGESNDSDVTDLEKKLEQYEQRLAELEARKAELEAQ